MRLEQARDMLKRVFPGVHVEASRTCKWYSGSKKNREGFQVFAGETIGRGTVYEEGKKLKELMKKVLKSEQERQAHT